MLFRCAGIVEDSVVDGPGLRLSIFFQGCPHHCLGCHNPQTWDLKGGQEKDTQDILEYIKDSGDLWRGITITGGEPFLQPQAVYELATQAKLLDKDVWCYTGYLHGDLKKMENEYVQKALKVIDVLVDGPFVLNLKSYNLRWRGSSNQRVIDLKTEKEISDGS